MGRRRSHREPWGPLRDILLPDRGKIPILGPLTHPVSPRTFSVTEGGGYGRDCVSRFFVTPLTKRSQRVGHFPLKCEDLGSGNFIV